MRISKVSTKGGDKGETSIGSGLRVPKDDDRIEAYGTVDELNSLIGVCLACDPCEEAHVSLERIQHELFVLGGEICLPKADREKWKTPVITTALVEALEADMEVMLEPLPDLEDFILPGGCLAAAQMQLARTVCRRAERLLVTFMNNEGDTGPEALKYLNRLSDLLFVMGRFENLKNDIEEPMWNKAAYK